MKKDDFKPRTDRGGFSGSVDEAAGLQQVIAVLGPLGDEAKLRIIKTACTFFGLSVKGEPVDAPDSRPTVIQTVSAPRYRFSEVDSTPTVKKFLSDKAPATDVERVACLAYFLAHYRGTRHFKTKDITELNTEAAQRKFSNTAFAVENATKAGHLVPSIKGSKQLSASGEKFVELLPDRHAARAAVDRPRRVSSKRGSKRR